MISHVVCIIKQSNLFTNFTDHGAKGNRQFYEFDGLFSDFYNLQAI